MWSELKGTADIEPLRREIQRDHVNRIAGSLLQPQHSGRADTRSLMRAQARGLLQDVRVAADRRRLGDETRAHLQDVADTLEQALGARLQRGGA